MLLQALSLHSKKADSAQHYRSQALLLQPMTALGAHCNPSKASISQPASIHALTLSNISAQ